MVSDQSSACLRYYSILNLKARILDAIDTKSTSSMCSTSDVLCQGGELDLLTLPAFVCSFAVQSQPLLPLCIGLCLLLHASLLFGGERPLKHTRIDVIDPVEASIELSLDSKVCMCQTHLSR